MEQDPCRNAWRRVYHPLYVSACIRFLYSSFCLIRSNQHTGLESFREQKGEEVEGHLRTLASVSVSPFSKRTTRGRVGFAFQKVVTFIKRTLLHLHVILSKPFRVSLSFISFFFGTLLLYYIYFFLDKAVFVRVQNPLYCLSAVQSLADAPAQDHLLCHWPAAVISSTIMNLRHARM